MNIASIPRAKALRPALLALTILGVLFASQAAYVLDDQPIASVGALAFSKYRLAAGGAVAYRGDYVRSTWDGDLVAYDVANDGSTGIKWRARTPLAAISWDTDRKIFTSSASGTGVPFRWNGTPALTTTQQAALGDATEGPKVLNYLRGDATNELTATNLSGTYRQRYSRVGAVVHSRPFYYKHGVDTAGDPIASVYVGANDGMLHSFDAFTGAELFAYVPSMLFGKLKALSTPSTTTFKYYVDGLLSIAPVPRSSGGDMTLLVGGLGAGGKGLFGLDVTAPSPASESAAAAMASFEITEASSGFANLGNVYSSPQIVKLNNGKTVVLVANGVNSTSGVASLFVIDALSGAKLAEISAGAGPDNGLSGIAVIDKDGNGTADIVYAGDLKGTLWKFDLSSAAYPTAATALFTPTAATARPITVAPSVMAHPKGGFQVNFGTGQVFASADLTSTTTEYLYGIWDNSKATGTTLKEPTLTSTTVTVGSQTMQVRVGSASTVNYASGGDKGWRISLTGGERLLGGDTLTDSGRFAITTSVPNTGTTQGSWLLQIDALTGGSPSQPFFDLNGDGLINKTDNSDRVAVTSSGTVTQVPPSGRFLGSGVWSQPVLAQLNATLDLPFFNYNTNSLPAATTTTATSSSTGRGVYGGHFDVDIYYNVCNPLSTSGYSATCTSNTHKHEYDKTYDVVGVNFLNASNSAFNLLNAIPSTTTSFKILVTNTNWSPAAKLVVGGVEKYVWEWPVSPEGFLAATAGGPALILSRATIGSLIFKLPVDGFTNKEWKPGSGDVRAGLIPTKTGCVRSNTGGQGGIPTATWMNGALTFQIVKSTTMGSSVEANGPTVTGAGGYRLKKNMAAQSNQLAQYTTFWHHPNGFCIGDVGWTKTPAADTSISSARAVPAPGSADPTGRFLAGDFGSAGSIGGGTTTVVTYLGVEVIVTRTFSDVGITQVIRDKATGAVLSTTVSPFGSIERTNVQEGSRAKIGRIAWQELVR